MKGLLLSFIVLFALTAYGQVDKKIVIQRGLQTVPVGKVWRLVPNKETPIKFSTMKKFSTCTDGLKFIPSTICCLTTQKGADEVSTRINLSSYEKVLNAPPGTYVVLPATENIVFRQGEQVYVTSCLETITVNEFNAQDDIFDVSVLHDEMQDREAELQKQKEEAYINSTIFDCNAEDEKLRPEECSKLLNPEKVEELITALFVSYLKKNPTEKELLVDYNLKFIVDGRGKVSHIESKANVDKTDSVILMAMNKEELAPFKDLKFDPALFKEGRGVNSLYELKVVMYAREKESPVNTKRDRVYLGEKVADDERHGIIPHKYNYVELDSASLMFQQMVRQNNLNTAKREKYKVSYLTGEYALNLLSEHQTNKSTIKDNINVVLKLE